MTLRIENEMPQGGVALLRHSYLFVTEHWQHLTREPIPDQGFEERFRESCLLPGWEYRNIGNSISGVSSRRLRACFTRSISLPRTSRSEESSS